jgi:transposase
VLSADIESVDAEQTVREKFDLIVPELDERARRAWAATEALALGFGGVSIVHRATGIAISTIRRGVTELMEGNRPAPDRVRRPGGGRKPATETDPHLLSDLEKLLEPSTRGDPESELRWTIKSVRRLAAELRDSGHQVSHVLVARLLRELGFSLQANRKVREGGTHPDRNAQFEHINREVKKRLRRREPSISVDTKKKELVGSFKNPGREWYPQGKPPEVKVHDFIDPELGKAIPYGVYDIGRNEGWVSVGVDHDTSEFAVTTIRRWWRDLGKRAYPRSRRLLIVADGGGSNGYRVRLWKWELQKFADRSGLTISVCHLPPGTSKWNKIEHRLFSFISQNWRGKPLLTRATVVNLIAHTTTTTGLKVHAYLDVRTYPTAIEVSDEQMGCFFPRSLSRFVRFFANAR